METVEVNNDNMDGQIQETIDNLRENKEVVLSDDDIVESLLELEDLLEGEGEV